MSSFLLKCLSGAVLAVFGIAFFALLSLSILNREASAPEFIMALCAALMLIVSFHLFRSAFRTGIPSTRQVVLPPNRPLILVLKRVAGVVLVLWASLQLYGLVKYLHSDGRSAVLASVGIGSLAFLCGIAGVLLIMTRGIAPSVKPKRKD